MSNVAKSVQKKMFPHRWRFICLGVACSCYCYCHRHSHRCKNFAGKHFGTFRHNGKCHREMYKIRFVLHLMFFESRTEYTYIFKQQRNGNEDDSFVSGENPSVIEWKRRRNAQTTECSPFHLQFAAVIIVVCWQAMVNVDATEYLTHRFVQWTSWND